ncbi:MAG: hypothetical protein Q7S11_04630 [bacterium]|nr:hypothetical protein [bacterium]
MKSIWKFPLEVTDNQTVELPVGAKALSVQVQNEKPCLWAMVDTKTKIESRVIQIFGTGHPVLNEGDYIGTFQMLGGSLVFHAFIKPN